MINVSHISQVTSTASGGGLGRKEFFADAFAAIASAQRPALVDMLSGNTRIALG